MLEKLLLLLFMLLFTGRWNDVFRIKASEMPVAGVPLKKVWKGKYPSPGSCCCGCPSDVLLRRDSKLLLLATAGKSCKKPPLLLMLLLLLSSNGGRRCCACGCGSGVK